MSQKPPPCPINTFPNRTQEVVRSLPSGKLWRREDGLLHGFVSDAAARSWGMTTSSTTVEDRNIVSCPKHPQPYETQCPIGVIPDGTLVKSLPSGMFYRRRGGMVELFPNESVLLSHNIDSRTITATVDDVAMAKCPATQVREMNMACPINSFPNRTQQVVRSLPSRRLWRREDNMLHGFVSDDAAKSRGMVVAAATVKDDDIKSCIIHATPYDEICPITGIADQTYVKALPSNIIYKRRGGDLDKYTSAEVLASYGVDPKTVVQTVTDTSVAKCAPTQINTMPMGCAASTLPSGAIVQATPSRTLYKKEGDQLRKFPTTAVYQSYSSPTVTATRTDAAVANCQFGADMPAFCGIASMTEGAIIKGVPSGTIYKKEDGRLRKFPSYSVYTALGRPPIQHTVPDAALMSCVKGTDMVVCPSTVLPEGTVIKASDSNILYKKDKGLLRPFNATTYAQWGSPVPRATYTEDQLERCPKGAAMTAPDFGCPQVEGPIDCTDRRGTVNMPDSKYLMWIPQKGMMRMPFTDVQKMTEEDKIPGTTLTCATTVNTSNCRDLAYDASVAQNRRNEIVNKRAAFVPRNKWAYAAAVKTHTKNWEIFLHEGMKLVGSVEPPTDPNGRKGLMVAFYRTDGNWREFKALAEGSYPHEAEGIQGHYSDEILRQINFDVINIYFRKDGTHNRGEFMTTFTKAARPDLFTQPSMLAFLKAVNNPTYIFETVDPVPYVGGNRTIVAFVESSATPPPPPSLSPPPPSVGALDPATVAEGEVLQTTALKLFRKEGSLLRPVATRDALYFHGLPEPTRTRIPDAQIATVPKGPEYPAPTADAFIAKLPTNTGVVLIPYPDPDNMTAPMNYHYVWWNGKYHQGNPSVLDAVPEFKAWPRVAIGQRMHSDLMQRRAMELGQDFTNFMFNPATLSYACTKLKDRKYTDFLDPTKQYVMTGKIGTKVPNAGTYRDYNPRADYRRAMEGGPGIQPSGWINGPALKHFCNYDPAPYCTLEDADPNYRRADSIMPFNGSTPVKLNTASGPRFFAVDPATKRLVDKGTTYSGTYFNSDPNFFDDPALLAACKQP